MALGSLGGCGDRVSTGNFFPPTGVAATKAKKRSRRVRAGRGRGVETAGIFWRRIAAIPVGPRYFPALFLIYEPSGDSSFGR